MSALSQTLYNVMKTLKMKHLNKARNSLFIQKYGRQQAVGGGGGTIFRDYEISFPNSGKIMAISMMSGILFGVFAFSSSMQSPI